MQMGDKLYLIAPYAAWMVLMTALPSTPCAYAIRTAIVALMLVVFALRSKITIPSWADIAYGILLGLVVFGIWILPEQFNWQWYRSWCIIGEGGTTAIAESSSYFIAIRLIGSAFVIAIAEELFFRKWLIPFAGFGWMVALFAIEHDRYLVGAIAGALYGWIYLRRGISSAVIAHSVTNLVLGLWVLKTGQWQFW